MAKADPETRAAVVELANEGLPFRQIAKRLGITASAVAGHVNRARAAGVHVDKFREFKPGLRPGTKARGLQRAESRKRAQALPGVAAAAGLDSAPRPAPPPSLSRRRTCQFPVGERGVDFRSYLEPGVFCGEPACEGSSYCPAHHKKTHVRRHADQLGGFEPRPTGAVDTAWR